MAAHFRASVWAAMYTAPVTTMGVFLHNLPYLPEWWIPIGWLLLFWLAGVPIAVVVGLPLTWAGLGDKRYYIRAGIVVSILFYLLYFSYRWWWQADTPLFPSLRTSLGDFPLLVTLYPESVVAICILASGPIAALGYWNGEHRAP